MALRLYDTARNTYRRIRGLPLPPLVLRDHTDWINSVAFLPDGKQVISCSADNSIRAWRVEDGRQMGTVMEEGGPVCAVAVSGDGRWIASGGQQKNITIWDAATHEKVVEWGGHSDWVRSLAFSPDSARLVSGSDDETVIVWSTTTGERLAGPLKRHSDWVYSVQFSSNGDAIAICDGTKIRIWNSHSGELVIPPIETNASSLAWTPDDQRLIAGCWNGSIKCFDPSTGSLLAEWKGHTDVVYSIAVSHNGKFIASGSWDNTVRLWDATSFTQIGPVLQHNDCVLSVAISPDGNHLVSGGDDKKVIPR
ncbi:WD40 repeat-like protein [Gyrodon lividus]|nr:WD40 repeat-like protein [Gyrodon lividus]